MFGHPFNAYLRNLPCSLMIMVAVPQLCVIKKEEEDMDFLCLPKLDYQKKNLHFSTFTGCNLVLPKACHVNARCAAILTQLATTLDIVNTRSESSLLCIHSKA